MIMIVMITDGIMSMMSIKFSTALSTMINVWCIVMLLLSFQSLILCVCTHHYFWSTFHCYYLIDYCYYYYSFEWCCLYW